MWKNLVPRGGNKYVIANVQNPTIPRGSDCPPRDRDILQIYAKNLTHVHTWRFSRGFMHEYSPSPGVRGKIRMGQIFIHEYICKNIWINIHIPWGKSASPGEMSEKMCIFEGGLYIKIPGGVKPKPMTPGDCQK